MTAMNEEIVIVHADAALMQQAFALRHEVFVVEQCVPVALEIDEYDAIAVHLLARREGVAVATLRLLPDAERIKIGRVAVSLNLRCQGIGRRLMQRALDYAAASGFGEAILDAQVSSMPFYRRLGFVEGGDIFDDAGIPHMRMSLRLR
ncbi:MAG: GNAT family N-acetyltransferase [Sulfuriferula sp.]|nr:GNAT family N-acetyltransferase [Sulfuriferula sp.]